MLGFYLNNKPFLLNESSGVRLTWTSPACMFKDFSGDIGMGINIPVNDNNRALLGNPERFEKYTEDNDREFQNFETRFKGVLLMAGTLVITNANADSYNGWLRSQTGNMGKEFREKYLTDMLAFDQEIPFENKANYDPLTDHYGCPKIYNPEFFKDKGSKGKFSRTIVNPDWYEGSDEEQFIEDPYENENLTEAFRRSSFLFVNQLNPDNTVQALSSTLHSTNLIAETLPVSVVSPMLFLKYTVETVLKEAGFAVNQNCLADDPDLQKLIIYNNYDITKMGFYTSDSIPFNSPFYDANSTQSRGIILNFIWRDYTENFKYKYLLPRTKPKHFILGMQNLLNICFHFRHDGKVDIIDRETIIDGEVIDIDKYMVDKWELGEKKNETLKFKFTHDKNDTYFQERWEDIDNRREDEGDPVDTIEDLDNITDPTVGEVRYIKSLNNYFHYSWIQQVHVDPKTGDEKTENLLGWFHLAAGFQNGFVNPSQDQEDVIETQFSTLGQPFFGGIVGTNQPGNIKSIKYAYQNFSPRLLFYIGNNQCAFETENIALDWEKQNIGLLAKRWPIWSRFWSTRQPITGKANLPLNMIDYLSRNITKKIRCRTGEFIIEEMETSFSLHAIEKTTIKAYKI